MRAWEQPARRPGVRSAPRDAPARGSASPRSIAPASVSASARSRPYFVVPFLIVLHPVLGPAARRSPILLGQRPLPVLPVCEQQV